MRPMTVRLDDQTAEELALVARVAGVSIAQEIKTAIDRQMAARRADPEFQALLRQRLQADQHAARRLAGKDHQ